MGFWSSWTWLVDWIIFVVHGRVFPIMVLLWTIWCCLAWCRVNPCIWVRRDVDESWIYANCFDFIEFYCLCLEDCDEMIVYEMKYRVFFYAFYQHRAQHRFWFSHLHNLIWLIFYHWVIFHHYTYIYACDARENLFDLCFPFCL